MPCTAWPEGRGMSGACEWWWVIRLKPPLVGDEYIQFFLFFLPLSLQVPVIVSHVSYWLLLLFLMIFQLILFFWGGDVLSHGQLFATPWTVARQVPLSMEFSRKILEWVAISFSILSRYVLQISTNNDVCNFHVNVYIYYNFLLSPGWYFMSQVCYFKETEHSYTFDITGNVSHVSRDMTLFCHETIWYLK